MSDSSKTFSDFITDKDGDYSQAQFISLARQLLEQGRRPERVFRAMLRAAYDVSIQHSISEHRDFLIYAAKDTADWLQQVENYCDDMIDQNKRETT